MYSSKVKIKKKKLASCLGIIFGCSKYFLSCPNEAISIEPLGHGVSPMEHFGLTL